MRAALLPRSPPDVLFVLLLLWLGSNVGGYLLSVGWGKPLYAYLALLVFAVGYLFVQGTATGKFAFLQMRWTRRFTLWLLLYAAYGAVTFLQSSQSQVAVQSLIYVCEAVAMGFGFIVLMLDPRRHRQAIAALALLAVFASAMNVFDFFDPMFSDVPGRGAGFYANPNISGAFVPLAMLCGIAAIPRRLQWPFVLVCGIGVVATFSRGAWLMWGIGAASLGWHTRGAGRNRRLVAAVMASLLGIWFLVAVSLGQLGDWLMSSSLKQYLDPNTLARLGVGGFSISDFAAQQRAEAALYAWHQIELAPFFGHGIGYVFEWGFWVGPHNMFLRFMTEGGLAGLILYLGLFWILWRASIEATRVTVLGFLLASFFSHNLLDQPEFILVLTFVVVDAALRGRRRASEAMAHHSAVTA